jgi:hypothetical protein
MLVKSYDHYDVKKIATFVNFVLPSKKNYDDYDVRCLQWVLA